MNGSIPDDKIEEVRRRADIVSLIGEYVTLKKAGKNYLGLCPFHREKTPSFTVSPDKQMFYCFGCSEGGNVVFLPDEAQPSDLSRGGPAPCEEGGGRHPREDHEPRGEGALHPGGADPSGQRARGRFFYEDPPVAGRGGRQGVSSEEGNRRVCDQDISPRFCPGGVESSCSNFWKRKGFRQNWPNRPAFLWRERGSRRVITTGFAGE